MGAFNRLGQILRLWGQKDESVEDAVQKTAQDRLHHEAEGGTIGGLRGSMVGEVYPKSDVTAAITSRVYSVVPSVYTIVNRKASMASTAPMRLYRKDTRTGQVTEYTTGLIAGAWQNPHPFLTRTRLIWELVAWLEITGRAYLRLEQSAEGKYFFSVLESSNVTVVTDPIKKVKAYVYTINGKKQFIPMDELAEFSEFNPTDYWFGLSPLSSMARDIDVERNIKKWLQAQFERGNMKGGMIQSEKKIDDQELLKLKAEWKNRKPQSSRVMFLPKDMTFTPFTEGGQEAPVKELLQDSFDTVALAFGMLPVLFGHSSAAKPEPLDVVESFVWNSELTPLLTYIGEVLTAKFAPLLGSNFFFAADTTQIPALRRDDMDCTRVNVAQTSVGKRTINEWRAIDGEAPLSDDVHGVGATEFGNMPIPMWEFKMQAKMAHLQASLQPMKNPDGSMKPGSGLNMSDQTSPALPTPGSEGGRRDQSQNGEPQMIDQTAQRSMEFFLQDVNTRKARILTRLDRFAEFFFENDDEKGLKEE